MFRKPLLIGIMFLLACAGMLALILTVQDAPEEDLRTPIVHEEAATVTRHPVTKTIWQNDECIQISAEHSEVTLSKKMIRERLEGITITRADMQLRADEGVYEDHQLTLSGNIRVESPKLTIDSEEMVMTFPPAHIVMTGNVRLNNEGKYAFADEADYLPSEETMTLRGKHVLFLDPESDMRILAKEVILKQGEVKGVGNVKLTFDKDQVARFQDVFGVGIPEKDDQACLAQPLGPQFEMNVRPYFAKYVPLIHYQLRAQMSHNPNLPTSSEVPL